jgi:hypothetical protein
VAHKYTILRNHSHNDNGHNTGYHYVMTGYRADFPDGNTRMPNNHLYPSIGSVVSRELGPKTTLPPYINMPHMMAGGGPGFYGSEHAPFVIESNPAQPDFAVDTTGLDGRSQPFTFDLEYQEQVFTDPKTHDAALIGGPRIPPGDGVVPHGSPAPLQEKRRLKPLTSRSSA